MNLVLFYGTEGNEIPDDIKERRMQLMDMAQEFIVTFEKELGSVNCMDLLAWTTTRRRARGATRS
jgi:hypothetical protein